MQQRKGFENPFHACGFPLSEKVPFGSGLVDEMAMSTAHLVTYLRRRLVAYPGASSHPHSAAI